MTDINLLKPYTVYYRDFKNHRLENCIYALDAYEARTLAMDFNEYINSFLPIIAIRILHISKYNSS